MTKHCENPFCGLPIAKTHFNDHVVALTSGSYFDGTMFTQSNPQTGQVKQGRLKIKLRFCNQCNADWEVFKFKAEGQEQVNGMAQKIIDYWYANPAHAPKKLFRSVTRV